MARRTQAKPAVPVADFGAGYAFYGDLLRRHANLVASPPPTQPGIMAADYLEAPEKVRDVDWVPKAEDMGLFSEGVSMLRGLRVADVIWQAPGRLTVTMNCSPDYVAKEKVYVIADGGFTQELPLDLPEAARNEAEDLTFAVDVPVRAGADSMACEIATPTGLLFYGRIGKGDASDKQTYRFRFSGFDEDRFRIFVYESSGHGEATFRYIIDDRLHCSPIARMAVQAQFSREVWELPVVPRLSFRSPRRVKLLGTRGDPKVNRGEFIAFAHNDNSYWMNHPLFDGDAVTGTIVAGKPHKEPLVIVVRTASGDVRARWPLADRAEFRFRKAINSFAAAWDGRYEDLLGISIGTRGGENLCEIPADWIRNEPKVLQASP